MPSKGLTVGAGTGSRRHWASARRPGSCCRAVREAVEQPSKSPTTRSVNPTQPCGRSSSYRDRRVQLPFGSLLPCPSQTTATPRRCSDCFGSSFYKRRRHVQRRTVVRIAVGPTLAVTFAKIDSSTCRSSRRSACRTFACLHDQKLVTAHGVYRRLPLHRRRRSSSPRSCSRRDFLLAVHADEMSELHVDCIYYGLGVLVFVTSKAGGAVVRVRVLARRRGRVLHSAGQTCRRRAGLPSVQKR